MGAMREGREERGEGGKMGGRREWNEGERGRGRRDVGRRGERVEDASGER